MTTDKYRELAEKQRKMAVSSCEIAGTGWIKSALNEAADAIEELVAMVEAHENAKSPADRDGQQGSIG